MDQPRLECPACEGQLTIERSWRKIVLRCRSCSAEFSLKEAKDHMDDGFERQVADVRCDRIWSEPIVINLESFVLLMDALYLDS